MTYTMQRYESTRSRTTAQVEWRVWNQDHSCFTPFKTKRDAVAYMDVVNAIVAEEIQQDLAAYSDFMDQVI